MVKVRLWTRDSGTLETATIEMPAIPKKSDDIYCFGIFKSVSEDNPMKRVRYIEWINPDGEFIPNVWVYAPREPSEAEINAWNKKMRILKYLFYGIILGALIALSLKILDNLDNTNNSTNNNRDDNNRHELIHMVDAIGGNYNSFGMTGNDKAVFVGLNPDHSIVMQGAYPCVGIIGQISENMRSTPKIQVKQDTERTTDPVNK